MVIALLLFAYVRSTYRVTREVQIRVEQPGLPAGLVISNRLPSYVNVSLSGSRETMDFPVSNFRIYLSNPNPVARDEPQPFRTVLLPEPPSGIKVHKPDSIDVIVDTAAEKTVFIEPILKVSAAFKASAAYVQVRPRTVRVSGPSRLLDAVDRIRTDPLEVDEAFLAEAVAAGRGPGGVARAKRAVLLSLPEFISLARGQTPNIELQMTPRAEGTAPEGFQDTTLAPLDAECVDGSGEYIVKAEPSLSAVIRTRVGVTPRATARFHCFADRIQLSEEQKSFTLEDAPVEIEPNPADARVLSVSTLKVKLVFERRPRAAEIGLQGCERHSRDPKSCRRGK